MVFLVVCCRDNNARLFARVRKHYYSRRYGEKDDLVFSRDREYSMVHSIAVRKPLVAIILNILMSMFFSRLIKIWHYSLAMQHDQKCK